MSASKKDCACEHCQACVADCISAEKAAFKRLNLYASLNPDAYSAEEAAELKGMIEAVQARAAEILDAK